MNYTPHVDLAMASVEHIMRDGAGCSVRFSSPTGFEETQRAPQWQLRTPCGGSPLREVVGRGTYRVGSTLTPHGPRVAPTLMRKGFKAHGKTAIAPLAGYTGYLRNLRLMGNPSMGLRYNSSTPSGDTRQTLRIITNRTKHSQFSNKDAKKNALETMTEAMGETRKNPLVHETDGNNVSAPIAE